MAKAKSTPPAADAPAQPGPQRHSEQHLPLLETIKSLLFSIILLTLAALNSAISQATLSPVFGSIPSTRHHPEALIASTSLGFLLHYLLPNTPNQRITPLATVWAFWTPTIQSFIFPFSGTLGPQAGPALLGFLSCHCLLVLTVYAAAKKMEQVGMALRVGRFPFAVVFAATGAWYISTASPWFESTLSRLRILSAIFSPVNSQLMLGSIYACLTPVTPVLHSIIPTVLLTIYRNPHFESAGARHLLNEKLQQHNWRLLDRQWSNTGYISVLENQAEGYRVLRCDHSLLGGEWQLTPSRQREEGWTENQSIYSVFEMLEAVRLLDLGVPSTEAEESNEKKEALVIGLGIGTVAKALIAQGIHTTIIELDEGIYRYAVKYFSLPKNHSIVISDAVTYLSEALGDNEEKAKRYDYIIHDVFTGGSEPLSLFTTAFLEKLHARLKPNGAVTINYAGNVFSPLTRRVLNTIERTFAGQCTTYRDLAEEATTQPPTVVGGGDGIDSYTSADFANLVVFCRKTPGEITFLQPDSLDVAGRKSLMRLDPKLRVPFPLQHSSNRTAALEDQILREGEESLWSEQQFSSAIRHWHIMRDVIPDVVWDIW